jgi:NDP-sugar pyrophosphorylase family protein
MPAPRRRLELLGRSRVRWIEHRRLVAQHRALTFDLRDSGFRSSSGAAVGCAQGNKRIPHLRRAGPRWKIAHPRPNFQTCHAVARSAGGLTISDTELAPVCILAGGLGSRLGDAVKDTPKGLLEVAGEPFLIHQLRLLARAGARQVVLCVGYLGDRIEETIGRSRFGIRVEYSHDGLELAGTLGAIRQAVPLLGERFLTLYGDTYLRIDYRAFDSSWRSSRLPAAMAVLRNRGKWGPSNATFANGLVTAYDKSEPTPGMEWIDYGLGGLSARALEVVSPETPDLAALHHELARRGLLFGFEATERFYEIGTRDALKETEQFLYQDQRGHAAGS